MAEFKEVASGNFTSDGTTKTIALRSDFDYFEVINYTQMATTQSTGRGVRFEWRKGYPDAAGDMVSKEDSANTVTYERITSGGFTRIDQAAPSLGAAKATSGTDVTAADPAVVTSTAHGFSNGDRVRIYGTTGMLQIAGYDFTIGNVSANDFELSYLDASGFAAVATAGFVRKVNVGLPYVPEINRITKVSQASSAVVTLAVTHGLSVGQLVRLKVPSAFGMVEADGLSGKITAISTANNTVTLDIDSSAFSAFAFPTSAVAAAGVSPALLIPYGDDGSVLDGAVDNGSQILMSLAAGADSPAGSSSDVIYWRALASGFTNYEV